MPAGDEGNADAGGGATGAAPAARPLPVMPLLGVAVGLWGMLPRFLKSGLNTEDTVEVVDHVIPGAVVMIVSLVALAVARKSAKPGPLLFIFGLVVLLAGLFMFATHVPLVMQATRGEAPWGGTVFHTSAALAVFGLGMLWATTYWSETAPEAETEAAATEK